MIIIISMILDFFIKTIIVILAIRYEKQAHFSWGTEVNGYSCAVKIKENQVDSIFCEKSTLLIHQTAQQSRPTMITIFSRAVRPSFSTFQNKAKENTFFTAVVCVWAGRVDHWRDPCLVNKLNQYSTFSPYWIDILDQCTAGHCWSSVRTRIPCFWLCTCCWWGPWSIDQSAQLASLGPGWWISFHCVPDNHSWNKGCPSTFKYQELSMIHLTSPQTSQ